MSYGAEYAEKTFDSSVAINEPTDEIVEFSIWFFDCLDRHSLLIPNVVYGYPLLCFCMFSERESVDDQSTLTSFHGNGNILDTWRRRIFIPLVI